MRLYEWERFRYIIYRKNLLDEILKVWYNNLALLGNADCLMKTHVLWKTAVNLIVSGLGDYVYAKPEKKKPDYWKVKDRYFPWEAYACFFH